MFFPTRPRWVNSSTSSKDSTVSYQLNIKSLQKDKLKDYFWHYLTENEPTVCRSSIRATIQLVACPGEGPWGGGGAPLLRPLTFGPNGGPKGRKNFFKTAAPLMWRSASATDSQVVFHKDTSISSYRISASFRFPQNGPICFYVSC